MSNKIIKQIRLVKTANNGKGQKLITIPFKSNLQPGQYVEIVPVNVNREY